MTLRDDLNPGEEAAQLRAQISAIAAAAAPENREAAVRRAVDEATANPARIAVLQALVMQMDEEQARLEENVDRMNVLVAAKDLLIEKLIQAVKDLKALKFGKRSEKLSPDQLALALEDVVITTTLSRPRSIGSMRKWLR